MYDFCSAASENTYSLTNFDRPGFRLDGYFFVLKIFCGSEELLYYLSAFIIDCRISANYIELKKFLEYNRGGLNCHAYSGDKDLLLTAAKKL